MCECNELNVIMWLTEFPAPPFLFEDLKTPVDETEEPWTVESVLFDEESHQFSLCFSYRVETGLAPYGCGVETDWRNKERTVSVAELKRFFEIYYVNLREREKQLKAQAVEETEKNLKYQLAKNLFDRLLG